MATMDAVRTTIDVANRFNELAQQGQWNEIQNELFSDDAVSIEPVNSPGMKSVEGLKAIQEKENSLRIW